MSRITDITRVIIQRYFQWFIIIVKAFAYGLDEDFYRIFEKKFLVRVKVISIMG